MQQLNNLDVIILITVGISALIALSRGLVKEVLSIVGWVLAGASVIYLLPILNPITLRYVESGWMAGVATSIFILIVFMIIWIFSTGNIVGKIRSSKLSSLDRLLGLFFGVVRAFLLVILMYILVSWMMPEKSQPEIMKKSRYFQIAGDFAAPIEKLIPKDTLEAIRAKTNEVGLIAEDETKDKETVKEEDKADKKTKEQPSKEEAKKKEKSEVDALFEKLAQPQIEKMRKDKKTLETIKENFDGYNNHERDNLDRLIENTLQ